MRLRVVPLLLLVACGAKQWTTPVLDVRCGNLQLRFEERGKDLGFPSGAVFFTPALLINSGSEWKVFDATGEHMTPTGYTSLLPAPARFHRFPSSQVATDPYYIRPWTLYADPAVISEAEYDRVCACIDANIAAINAAWNKPRNPTANFELSKERQIVVESSLRIKHDPRFTYADRTTLGMLWDCPSNAAIKTDPPDQLVIFSTKDTWVGTIGRISRDQKHAELYGWSSLIPAAQRLTGPNYKEFYGRCRDAEGNSLYDTLAPVDWKNE